MYVKRRYGIIGCLLLLLILLGSVQVQAAGKPRLSSTRLQLKVTDTATLVLKRCPGSVQWRSSDKKAVQIKKVSRNKIKVTGMKKGTAVIRAVYKKKTYTCRVRVSKKTYYYLAIGNSLTFHPKCSFWWGDYGMAASSPEKDFMHQVGAKLSGPGVSVEETFLSLARWETEPQNRNRILKEMESMLDARWDVITVQAGDGVRSLYGFERDLSRLLKYVQKKNPKTELVVVGNFWTDSHIFAQSEMIKKRVCAQAKIPYADLAGIANNPAYQRGMGAIIYDASGIPHQVQEMSVARHPNDAGMAHIADQIVRQLHFS